MNSSEYQPVSDQELRLIEFAQFNLPLEGAIISHKQIEGSFGLAEIQSSRHEQIIVRDPQHNYHLFNSVDRAIITKSTKVKLKAKEQARKESESEEKFFSESSEKEKKVKKIKKRQKNAKKQLMSKITKLTSQKK